MTSNEEGGILELGRLGKFIEETMNLLLENKGAILLNQLLDFHRKKYEAFIVNDTEFPNLTSIFRYCSQWFTLVPTAKQGALLILNDYLSSVAQGNVLQLSKTPFILWEYERNTAYVSHLVYH